MIARREWIGERMDESEDRDEELAEDLRRASARQLAAMDFPGYAVGGLSVGEPKEVMWAMLEATKPDGAQGLRPPQRPSRRQHGHGSRPVEAEPLDQILGGGGRVAEQGLQCPQPRHGR